MKRVYLFAFAITIIMVSCGQGEQNKNNLKDSSQTTHSVENAETSVPGIEKLEFTDSIQLKANENMRFDKELFRVRAGWQVADVVQGLCVKDLNDVVVAERHVDQLAVPGDFDAARSLPGLDGCDRLQLVGVDHRDGIALLVGNISQEGERRFSRERKPEQGDSEYRHPAQIEHLASPTHRPATMQRSFLFRQSARLQDYLISIRRN